MNNSYDCKRCGYSTPYKNALINHLQKAKVCNAILSNIDRPQLIDELHVARQKKVHSLECEYCHKTYSTTTNLARHKKSCDANTHDGNIEQKLQLQQDRINQLETMLKDIMLKQNNTNNSHNVVTNNIVNYVLNTKPFGQENLEHISKDDLTSYALGLEHGFTSLVKHIHYHKNAPENNNIRHKSSKRHTVEVLEDDNMWVEHDTDWVVDMMVHKGWRLLYQHYIDNIGTDAFKDRDNVFTFLTDIGAKKGNKFYGIKREICVLIKNHTGNTLLMFGPNMDSNLAEA